MNHTLSTPKKIIGFVLVILTLMTGLSYAHTAVTSFCMPVSSAPAPSYLSGSEVLLSASSGCTNEMLGNQNEFSFQQLSCRSTSKLILPPVPVVISVHCHIYDFHHFLSAVFSAPTEALFSQTALIHYIHNQDGAK